MDLLWSEIKNEVWKPLDTNRAYIVSNLGRVASAASKVSITVLAPCDNGKGYKLITASKPKRKNYYIHRLVAHAFLPNPDNLPEVNHKDGNKANNRVTNLEWISLQSNRDHAVKEGLVAHGERVSSAKLTASDVIEIRRMFKENPSLNKSEIGRRYGVNCTAIIKIVKGQRWKRLTDPIFLK